MKQKFKRHLAVLTAVLMLLCILPYQAFALSKSEPPQLAYSDEKLSKASPAVCGTEVQHEIGKTCSAYKPVEDEYFNYEPAQSSLTKIPYVPRRTENRGSGEIWDGSIAGSYAGGVGTAEEPYLISNGAELAYLAQQTNAGMNYAYVYFKLVSDIYLNDITGWENWGNADANGNIITPENEWIPVGNKTNKFYGNIDGDGYAVYGIYINKPDADYQGLFGYAGGIIANLSIESSYIKGSENVGAIAGYYWVHKGAFDENNTHFSEYDFNKYVVVNCCNNGKICGDTVVGGIFGFFWGMAIDCVNNGEIRGTHWVGGIVGHNWGAYLNGCINTGNVTASGTFAGGIMGEGYGNIKKCVNSGIVECDYRVGGISGENYGYILECVNSGSIHSYTSAAGGIVGCNRGITTDCYNIGTVTGADQVGGVIGSNIKVNQSSTSCGKTINCYNIGSVSGDTNVGGAIGYNHYVNENGNTYDGEIHNCYYLNACAVSNDYGEPLTDEQMQTASSFENYDFTNVWTMAGKPDYPYPELKVREYQITFIDQRTHEQIDVITVLEDTVLTDVDFPDAPEHPGCEFLGWAYNGIPIYEDTVIKARYYDSNATQLKGYVTGGTASGSWGHWIEFLEYAPEEIHSLGFLAGDDTWAAAYAGGRIYGYLNSYDENDNLNLSFYIMDPETTEMTFPEHSYHPDIQIWAMAYDYTSDQMYAIGDKLPGSNILVLYKVNLAVGSLKYVADLNGSNEPLMTFAIDGEGNAYGLAYSDTNAELYNINLKTGECTIIGDTGLQLAYVQSMTWDHNSDRLFWAGCSADHGNHLYIIDPATGSVTDCGEIGAGGAEVTGLYVENNIAIAPVEIPEFAITFVDGVTGEELAGGYTVAPDTVLDIDTFPDVTEHEGYEYICWDYDGKPIFADTVITARYRDINQLSFYFEQDPIWEGWTWEDQDGDGVNWRWLSKLYMPDTNVPEGIGCMNSESYSDIYDSLTPDNWLISPLVPGGGKVRFQIVAQDKDCYEEIIGVYVSTDNGITWGEELGYYEASPEIQTIELDISAYSGQMVRIAFRHYDVEDLWSVNLDSVQIIPENAKYQITFIDGVNGSEIGEGYTVEPGNILDPEDFPIAPEHEGFEFTGWDYDGHAIYQDTVVTAMYRDPNALGWYFETDPALDGWTMLDNDCDGHNWQWSLEDPTHLYSPPEGEGCMISFSYDNDTYSPLTPDNWLISPEVAGGGSVSFKIVGQDPGYASEVVGVYASADGGNTWSDELGSFTSTGSIQTFTVDLADFAGMNIKLAFRHYNSTDQFCLNLDAVEVTTAGGEVPPTEEPPTEEPPTAEPPTAEPPTEEPPTEEPPTAEPEPQEGDVIFDIRNPETADGLYYAQPGETVTVEFTVAGEYAAHGLTVNFNYDPELLTIESLEEGAAMAEIRKVALPVLDYETIPGSICLGIMAPTDPFSAQGVIYTVSFKVAETAELGAVLPLEVEVAEFFNMPVGEEATPIPWFAYNSGIVVGDAPVLPTEPPTEEPPTEEPPTEEPPTEEPPTEEPTPPPHTGFISLAGAGIAAILAGAGVVLFRRKRR